MTWRGTSGRAAPPPRELSNRAKALRLLALGLAGWFVVLLWAWAIFCPPGVAR